ncbi:MAG: 3-ketoacyl-ACP reductase [Armatimonadetes bacterium]|nr:3-ketoacyl-ACP reductase [Armatimonadota bacterium]
MLERRVALVTGGSRGIGLGIVRSLLEEGLAVVLSGQRSAQDVQGVVDELRECWEDVLYVQADNSKVQDRQVLLDTVRKAWGRLDVLVNNAGVAPSVRADILDATEQSFDHLINVNLKGPYFLTQAAANWMIEQKRAQAERVCCVINVTSISADTASVNRGDYCLTKAALAMSSRLWSVRLAEYGINVYEIRPGIIATDMTSGVKDKYDALIEDGLLLQRRWGLPEDVGKAAAALVRGDFAYSTGQVIMVDGGFSISRL